ncbi:MAG TPA: hypothetical protein VL172_20185 [Kofleriaceae bacterium]|nr:hypothetical protein [Kofleriaceae bacterium]
MKGIGIAAVLVLALAAEARAQDSEPGELPPPPAQLSMSYQLREHLTLYGNELGAHLSTLSFNLVNFKFDGFDQRARLRLGGQLGSQLSLRIDGDVHFQHGLARVKTRVELGIVGRQLKLELPDFEMVPRSFGGERWVEVRLPLLEGTF